MVMNVFQVDPGPGLFGTRMFSDGLLTLLVDKGNKKVSPVRDTYWQLGT
jgi:hypothetical protein